MFLVKILKNKFFQRKHFKNIFLFFGLVVISSCIQKSKIDISMHTKKTPLNITVSNVQVVNHQIIITGTNLNAVSGFAIVEGANNFNMQIESKTATSLIANTVSNVSFAAGKIFDFILSNASAASSFTVDFSLCNSTLGTKGFNCVITPNDKEVLSYDAVSGKWKPRAVNGLSYQGAWDAGTALPVATTAGDYYIVSVAAGAYSVGDWIVYNGATFDQINNSTVITSVFGRTGAVTATKGDYTLTKMNDVDLTTTPPANNDILKYDGTNWVPGTVTSSGGTVTSVSGTAPVIVATGTTTPVISMAPATTAVNGYLTAADWTTFNSKEPSITAGTTAQYLRGDKSLATFATDVRAVVLTGLSMATNAVIAATDTLLAAFGKLQAQITANGTSISGKADTTNISQTITALTITGLGAPVAGSDAVNKTYVDGFGQWLKGVGGNAADIYFSTGNVGIGTSVPSGTLHVKSSSAANNIYLETSHATSNANGFILRARGTDKWTIGNDWAENGTQDFTIYDNVAAAKRMVIDSNGNFGLSADVPGGKLHIAGAGDNGLNPTLVLDNKAATQETFMGLSSNGTSKWLIGMEDSDDGGIAPYNFAIFDFENLAWRFVINKTNGFVGIGTTAPTYNLHVVGTAGLSTGTAWTNASDLRLKDIQGDYNYGLDEILKLHTVRYNYKKDNPLQLPSDFTKTGFIAQEVEKVIPEAVHKRDDGYLELNVDPIHWAVVNAIQDLYRKYIQPFLKSDLKQEREIASLQVAQENLKKEKDLQILQLKNENDMLKKRNEKIEERLNKLEKLLVN